MGGLNGGVGAGRLLGYQMGLMERVCAEVKHDSEDAANDISAEMSATLSLAEKHALKQHIIARLEGCTDQRSRN